MNLSELRRRASRPLALPVVPYLHRARLRPDTLTYLGLAGSLASAGLIAWGELGWGAALLLLASGADLLDGALARFSGRASPAGALLDSILDRLSEAAVFLGILASLVRTGHSAGIILTMLALSGSFLVSYIKARGEGLGLSCEVGLFTRPERVGVLVLGLLLHQLPLALTAIALFSFLTAAQRLYHLRRQMGGPLP